MKTKFIIIVILFVGAFNLYPQSIKNDSLRGKKLINDSLRRCYPYYRFIDKNGDGINDNAKDIDNDGIPDKLDPKYPKRLRYRHRHGWEKRDSLNKIDEFYNKDGKIKRGKR